LELITIIAVAAASFVATSFDNLLILVGLLGASYERKQVASGYLSGMLLVAIAAAGLSMATHRLPAAALGYLGLIPIGLGLWHLLQLRRPSARRDEARRAGGVWPVALVTVAASGDSLATFVALLSDSVTALAIPILATFAAGSLGWLALARFLSTHEGVVRILRRWGVYLIPLLLIVIGTYILLDSHTDVVG
jgi:cadmium resistance protein CadD (predicted permease)